MPEEMLHNIKIAAAKMHEEDAAVIRLAVEIGLAALQRVKYKVAEIVDEASVPPPLALEELHRRIASLEESARAGKPSKEYLKEHPMHKRTFHSQV